MCARAVASILENGQPDFHVLIVDQSTNDDTAEAVRNLPQERLVYLRSDTRGVAAARNVGVAHASTNIIVFTDDDCTMPCDWLVRS